MLSILKFRSLLFILIILSKSISFAIGGMEGGGGKSIVCRNSDGTIRSAEVLDLYEGRIQYGLSYTESSITANEQVLNILKNSHLGTGESMPPSTIHDWYLNLNKHIRFVPVDTVLNPIDDSFEVIAPTHCKIEQTVNYINDKIILISTEIWNAFSETQRAAILLHESVYRYLRNYGETDSRRARHFTAYLFSGGQIEEVYPGNDYYGLCSSSDQTQPFTGFYVSKQFYDSTGIEMVRLHFHHIAGRRLLSKSYVDVNNNNSSPGYTSPTFLDILKNPTIVGDGSSFMYQQLTTISAFEDGDILNLSISGIDHGKPAKISYSVKSSIDNKTLIGDMTCVFFEPLRF